MLGRKKITGVSLLVWFTGIGLAQVRSGSVVGLVVDSSGAPVPEAAVTVMSVETNVKSETRTNMSGQYTVPYLTAGRYTVTVTRVGFAAARTGEFEVGTAQTVRADLE